MTDLASANLRPGDRTGSTVVVRLGLFASLTAILLACCPVPAGSATDTAFAAELQTVSDGEAVALTDDGRRVHLTFDGFHPGQEFAVGQRVYVEGLLTGRDVQVRRIIRIETSRTA